MAQTGDVNATGIKAWIKRLRRGNRQRLNRLMTRLFGTVESANGHACAVRLDDGSLVQALKVNVNGEGERSTLSLRPERVVIQPEGERYPNQFEARVEELIYLGDHIRTRVNVCGSDQFVVKVPNAGRSGRIRQGDTVRVGWSMEDCRALDA